MNIFEKKLNHMNKKSTMQSVPCLSGCRNRGQTRAGNACGAGYLQTQGEGTCQCLFSPFFFYKKTQAFEKKGTIKSNCISLYGPV